MGEYCRCPVLVLIRLRPPPRRLAAGDVDHASSRPQCIRPLRVDRLFGLPGIGDRRAAEFAAGCGAGISMAHDQCPSNPLRVRASALSTTTVPTPPARRCMTRFVLHGTNSASGQRTLAVTEITFLQWRRIRREWAHYCDHGCSPDRRLGQAIRTSISSPSNSRFGPGRQPHHTQDQIVSVGSSSTRCDGVYLSAQSRSLSRDPRLLAMNDVINSRLQVARRSP